MATIAETTHLTPRLIAESMHIGTETVFRWIRSGELKAANIGNSKIKPRYRVAKTDLEAFLESRSNQPQQTAKRKKPTRRFYK